MLSQAQELKSLADALERDDQLFANAAIEILLTGYRSPLTSVALDLEEPDLLPFFIGSTLPRLRATIVSKIRQRADFRETLAYTGIYHEPGRIPANPAITEDVLQYFCSLDPAQMTKTSWEALWRAGYIVMRQKTGSVVEHTQNRADIGFIADVYVTPADVSFGNIRVIELNAPAKATGVFSPHEPPWAQWWRA